MTLEAAHRGNNVIITIRDDGGGIDVAKVRRKAVEKGLFTPDHAARLTDRQALEIIFQPGFSTAEKTTNVSGRGVGMDVVRSNIEKIGGTVDLSSREGRGTTVRIKIPLTLAIISALLVGAGSDVFAIPQIGVVELVRVSEADLSAAMRGLAAHERLIVEGAGHFPDNWVYVHTPSRIDPSMAPRGHSSLYLLVPVSHQHANIDWKAEAPRFREKVLDQVRKIGLPDLRPLIRHERMITPADWEHQHAIYRGATFNLAHNLGQMLHLRPGNRFADLEGVYLTGGGTHPGSGLPVIYESARISSRLLLQDIGLPYDHCVPEDNRTRPASLTDLLFGARQNRREKHQLTA